MSQIEDLYNKSAANNVVNARKIPENPGDSDPTGFAGDIGAQFQQGWANNQRVRGETSFKDTALNYYDEELRTMPPVPVTKEGIPVNRWNPNNGYADTL